MRQTSILIPLALGLLTMFLVPGSSSAQPSHTFSFGLMGGLGGSFDAEPDTGLDNFGWQARFGMEIDLRTRFAIRGGVLELEGDSTVPGLFDSELSYVTLSGEYTYPAGFYDSTLFLGLGIYDLAGKALIADENGIGITVGTSGEFRLTNRLFIAVEFAGHYADLDYAQFFVTGHAGLGFRF